MAKEAQSRVEAILRATIDKQDYNKEPLSRVEEDLLELKAAIDSGGGGGGTTDYTQLTNKPSIGGTTLEGNLTPNDIGAETDMTYTYDPSSETVTLQ